MIFRIIILLLFSLIPACGKYLWILPSGNTMTSSFGEFRVGHFHGGIDLRAAAALLAGTLADVRANRREGIGGADDLVGLRVPPLGDEPRIPAGVGVDRAGCLTGGQDACCHCRTSSLAERPRSASISRTRSSPARGFSRTLLTGSHCSSGSKTIW